MNRGLVISWLVALGMALGVRAQLIDSTPGLLETREPEFGLEMHLEPVDGERAVLWLTFSMPEDWHTYGPYQNDTGSVAIVDLMLPEGVREGERIWPVPERYIAPGDLLDYVYEGTVSIGTWLEGPSGWHERGVVAGDIEWLVCNEETCLPQFREGLQAEPISKGWRPVGVFPAGLADPAAAMKSAGVSIGWLGDRLVVEAAGAESVSVIPLRSGAVLASAIERGRSETGRLELSFDLAKSDRIEALIVIERRGSAQESASGRVEAVGFWALTGNEPNPVAFRLPESARQKGPGR